MGSMLRLGGAALVLICALIIGREYSGYLDGRLALMKDKTADELELEIDKAQKNKRVARALLIGGALALGVMIV